MRLSITSRACQRPIYTRGVATRYKESKRCSVEVDGEDTRRRKPRGSQYHPIPWQKLSNPQNRLLNHRQMSMIGFQSVQTRSISSWLPEVVQNFSIWGGTGYVIKTLHFDGTVPYWACFALMSGMLRTALIPLVVYSTKTSARFAKVAPDVQFLVTLFQNDLKKMRAEGKSLAEQRYLFTQNLQTLRGIYKLHNINPLTVFLSVSEDGITFSSVSYFLSPCHVRSHSTAFDSTTILLLCCNRFEKNRQRGRSSARSGAHGELFLLGT